jgi:hypothetical protein
VDQISVVWAGGVGRPARGSVTYRDRNQVDRGAGRRTCYEQ